MEQTFTHGIDLSRVTHRHGQSPDLEPKRQRAWERLDDRERRYVVSVYNKPVTDWDLPFSEVSSAYERVLYVLVTTDRALSAEQIAYLLIARHYRNADITSIRKQLAIGVRQEHLKLVGHNRYGSTEDADEKLKGIEQQWRARRNAARIERVVRASHAAGIESPDLSLEPPEEERTDEPTPELVPDTSLEERFPGMAGEFEGDPDGEQSDVTTPELAPDASLEERFPGMTGEFEGDAEGERSDVTTPEIAPDSSLEERFPGMTGEFEGDPDGDVESDVAEGNDQARSDD